MTMKPIPFALCLIIHTFWGNANASLPSESDEEDFISVHISHTQYPGMSGLAHVAFCLFDGMHSHKLPQMNVHSPATSPRELFSSPRKKTPLNKYYGPGSHTPKTYEKTYEISEYHFQNGPYLTASFFMEEVRTKLVTNTTTGQKTVEIIQFPWQGLDNILIADLKRYPLELVGDLTLQSLNIDIKWENMDEPTSTVTAFYRQKKPRYEPRLG